MHANINMQMKSMLMSVFRMYGMIQTRHNSHTNNQAHQQQPEQTHLDHILLYILLHFMLWKEE